MGGSNLQRKVFCVWCGIEQSYIPGQNENLAHLHLVRHDLVECEKSVLVSIADTAEWFLEAAQVAALQLPESEMICQVAYKELLRVVEERRYVEKAVNVEIERIKNNCQNKKR
jgi:hypothetical protein